jgi:hypothetical protein
LLIGFDCAGSPGYQTWAAGVTDADGTRGSSVPIRGRSVQGRALRPVLYTFSRIACSSRWRKSLGRMSPAVSARAP